MASGTFITETGIPCEIKNAVVMATLGDTQTVVAGVSGKKTRLLACVVYGSAGGKFTWKSGTSAFGGSMTISASNPLMFWPDAGGYLETATGAALCLTASLSAADGFITYALNPA